MIIPKTRTSKKKGRPQNPDVPTNNTIYTINDNENRRYSSIVEIEAAESPGCRKAAEEADEDPLRRQVLRFVLEVYL